MDWQLKGQGAANVVYSYKGHDPRLSGVVLRIRKSSAHVPSSIDQIIWAGVLDMSNDNYNLAYMSELMAPLLGSQHVVPGVICDLPKDLRALEAPGSEQGQGKPAAVIQPDHTTFQSGGVPGYSPVGPVFCLEIKPKWGLHPGEAPTGPLAPELSLPNGPTFSKTVVRTDAAAAGRDLPDTVAGKALLERAIGFSGAIQAASRMGARPAAGDGVPAAAPGVQQPAVAAYDIRQRYPRFMLHMVLKHAKNGIPLSRYNPLDLFSGDLGRMRTAVRCLIESPSNNLRVFKDGALLYGAQAGHALEGVVPSAGGDDADETLPGPSLEHVTAQLAALVGCGRAASEPPAGAGAAGDGGAGAPVGVAAPAPYAAPVSEQDQEDGEAAVGEQQAEQQERDGGGKRRRVEGVKEVEAVAGTCGRVLDDVSGLVALALQREGVLGRLRDAQALDPLGAEAALQLYVQLVAAVQAGELHLARAATPSDGLGQPSASDSAAGTDGPAAAAYGGVYGPGAAAWRPRLAALRRYLLSVTAKDCGVMVALQRARPLHRAPGHAAEADAAAGLAAAAGRTEAEAGAAGTGIAAAEAGVAPTAVALEAGTGAVATKAAAAAASATTSAPQAAGPQQPLEQDERQSRCQQQHPQPRDEQHPRHHHAGGCSAPSAPDGSDLLPGRLRLVLPPPRVGLLEDPITGATYLFKVAFVDLDLKAASKILKHRQLEERLLACAEENGALLQALAARAGWRT